MKTVLAFDQGTTSSRAIAFDHSGTILGTAQREFTQHYPKSGWVEHDANEIWESQLAVGREVIQQCNLDPSEIAAIGITNQRETTLLWDRATGEPVHNAIVWQDRRTAEFCDSLRDAGHLEMIAQKTGLLIDAYFCATKLRWLLDNVDGARERAERGELAFGTIDSWLFWKLTGGRVHATDVSNASRTMLFDINTHQWDDELLELLKIPHSESFVWRNTAGTVWRCDPAWWCRGRSAISPVWTKLHASWDGEKHLRHRLFHADEHR